MKCLFCGKDLPLFKRLAGAEFCSDEHRQQYQQEYSELALSRLTQQKSAPSKAGLPAKPQPTAESTNTSPSPKVSASPSMKLSDSKADGRKASPRSIPEPKSAEPRIVQTASAAPKPALVTKTSRPLVTPPSVTVASTASEPVLRPEPKKLSVTPTSGKPTRSIVPLQETKPIRVTETRASEPKATDAKAPENTRAVPVQELARQARPSAHSPLRLELPVGPTTHPLPERTVAAPDTKPALTTRKTEPPSESVVVSPVAEEVTSAPAAEVPLPQATSEQAVYETPIQALARQRAADSEKPVTQDAPAVTAPSPLADAVQSLPPSADWQGGTRAPELQFAAALQPELPRGGMRVRAASLNGATHLASGEILNPSALPPRVSPARLEIRDFARMEPVIEFKPIVEAPHVPAAEQAMTLSFLATALQTEPKLWAEPAREFGMLDQTGQQAFLEELTAGFDVLRDSATASAQKPASDSTVAPDPRPHVNGKAPHAPDAADLSREPQLVTLAKKISPEVIPGGKAKPVQMFTSTLRESVDAAIPPYEALPLRATMMVGPADNSDAVVSMAGNGDSKPKAGGSGE